MRGASSTSTRLRSRPTNRGPRATSNHRPALDKQAASPGGAACFLFDRKIASFGVDLPPLRRLSMLDAIWPWMHLAARVIFAGSLMILSASNFTSHENTASRTPPVPKGAMVASGIMVWAGAIMIASGWHRFIGSGLVILFLIP